MIGIGFRSQRGVVLLTVLLFVLIATLGASSLVQMQQTVAQREREEHLLFIGHQYRKAIASYYQTIPPAGARSLPRSLEDLVSDQRFARPVTHLRRLYPDPMTGQLDWELVTFAGGVIGVRSRSTRTPIKQSGFEAPLGHFNGAQSYTAWAFVAPVP